MDMNMQLTAPQKEAVVRGEAVPVVIESTECVIVRADVFQRVKSVLDDGLDAEQIGLLVDANMRDDDLADPLLDSYQR
jgi:hypothetical protein